MKEKRINIKKIILSLLLVLCLLLLFACGGKSKKLKDVTPEDKPLVITTSNLPYYKKDERIINLELKALTLNEKVSIVFKSNNTYYNLLNDIEKSIYDKLKTDFLSIDYTNQSSITNDYFLFDLSLASDTATIEKITNYFLFDHPGLFFISYNYELENKTVKLFTSKELFQDFELYLDKFLLNINLIVEEANQIPIVNKRAKKALEDLVTPQFKALKNTKKTAYSDYLISYYIDKETPNINTFSRLLAYTYLTLNLDSFYTEGKLNNNKQSGVYLYLQNHYFYINPNTLINDGTTRNIYKHFATTVPSELVKTYSILEDKISKITFNNNYKYTEAITTLGDNINVYRNRITLDETNDPYNTGRLINGKLSSEKYDEYKVPFTDFKVLGNEDFGYDYKYIGVNIEHDTPRILPDKIGEYKLIIKSIDNDTYFEVIINFKIARRYNVSFKSLPDDTDKESKRNFEIFEGDFVDIPKDPKIDGYVFKGYDKELEMNSPITGDITISFKFDKPNLTFYDEDLYEYEELRNKFIAIRDDSKKLDSKNILLELNPLKDKSQNEEIFIGFKIAIKNDKGNIEETQNFIGTNKERKQLIITSDLILIPIIREIKINIKGTAFQKIKRIKGVEDSFKVHPKQRIPDLGKVSFGEDISTTGFKFTKPYEDVRKQDKYDMIFTALSMHSFHEVERAVHLEIGENMFFSWGWVKANWILILVVIGLIVASPFLIRLIFRIIKKIRRSKKRRAKEREYDLEDREYEEELRRAEIRRKRKAKLQELEQMDEMDLSSDELYEGDEDEDDDDSIVIDEDKAINVEEDFERFWGDDDE